MKKNHGVLFGCAVIAIAAITLFAGCSNGSTDDPAPTAVVLAAGSHGTVSNGKITGLAEGSQYIVKTDAAWFGVDEEGKLVIPGHSSPADAIDDAEELTSEVTAITGLSNGTTYSVYEYFATALDDDKKVVDSGGSGGDVNTGGKNTIVDIDATTLQTTESITIEAGASAGGAGLVFLTGKAQLAEAGGTVSVHTRIKGNTTDGLTYSLSAVEGTANLAAVTAEDTYFSINNISADFTAVITAATAVDTTLKAEKSHGVVNALAIGTLPEGKYVVQHRGKWYATTGGSFSAALAASPASDLPAALAATSVSNTTAITTGLTADEVYDVYRVFTTVANNAIVDAGDVDTDNKNSVVDISVVNNGTQNTTVSISATALNGAPLYLTGVTAFSEANNETAFSANADLTGSSTLKAGTYAAYAAYAAGDTFFKVTGDNAGAVQIVRR